MAFILIPRFGRCIILLVGYAIITVCHIGTGCFLIFNYDLGVLICMSFFLVAYNCTTGQLAWIYTAETSSDIAYGVIIVTLWSCVLIELLTSEPLMNSAIGAQGVFFIFGISTFFAVFFVKAFMKETRGLTDKEKKSIYAPKP
jgi:hypothetical protein